MFVPHVHSCRHLDPTFLLLTLQCEIAADKMHFIPKFSSNSLFFSVSQPSGIFSKISSVITVSLGATGDESLSKPLPLSKLPPKDHQLLPLIISADYSAKRGQNDLPLHFGLVIDPLFATAAKLDCSRSDKHRFIAAGHKKMVCRKWSRNLINWVLQEFHSLSNGTFTRS